MKALGITISVIILLVVLVSGIWAYKYYTAKVRGHISAHEQIESKDSRIYNYEYFYSLLGTYKAYKSQLDAQRNRLELSQDPSTKERILANIAGIEGQKARVREEYNARASMVETRARFLGEDLPRRLE